MEYESKLKLHKVKIDEVSMQKPDGHWILGIYFKGIEESYGAGYVIHIGRAPKFALIGLEQFESKTRAFGVNMDLVGPYKKMLDKIVSKENEGPEYTLDNLEQVLKSLSKKVNRLGKKMVGREAYERSTGLSTCNIEDIFPVL